MKCRNCHKLPEGLKWGLIGSNGVQMGFGFGDSRSTKSAILTQVKALNFDFCTFLHFLKTKIHQITSEP